MNKHPALLKALKIAVFVEILYLVIINIALNLDLTRELINKIKPEKFQVSWESAYSWYPFRVHVTGLTANGQTRKQQWQVDSPAASASINLVPLLWKSVSLSGVDTTDVDFRLRPRPREDKDYSSIREYFAPIENRPLETKPPEITAPKKKRPWDISIGSIQATGKHKVWVYQVQLALSGDLEAGLDVQTAGGPFELEEGYVDVQIESMLLNGDREVIRNGRVKGTLEFEPFVPRENKGIKSLGFLTMDAEISAEANNLAFLNLYLSGFYGMKVNGKGMLDSHLKYDKGMLNADSSLAIAASELVVDMFDYRAQGEGKITLQVTDAQPDEMNFSIIFDELEGLNAQSGDVMFTGDGLAFRGAGTRQVLPVGGKSLQATKLTLEIPSVRVPDLAAYQHLVPPRMALQLHGGEGALQGTTELRQDGFGADLRLLSKAADVGVRDYTFTTDLDFAVKVDGFDVYRRGVNLAGTYFRMSDAIISNDDTGSSKPWGASIEIENGKLKLLLPENELARADQLRLRDLLRVTREQDVMAMLDSAEDKVIIRGKVSDLRWLNVLFSNKANLAFGGAGSIAADLVIEKGWLAPGTEIRVMPDGMSVEILDYVAEGGGEGYLVLAVEKGGENPDMSLDLKMVNASFRSKDEEKSFIEGTEILLRGNARGMSYKGPADEIELHLQIPSARVKDMSVYNHYLPVNSPLTIVEGEADLKADILLKSDDADGFVNLVSSGMQAIVDEQQIEADLVADIKLVDGVPRNMEFDITGSSVQIKNVSVIGVEKNFDNDLWGIKLNLDNARATWRKPVALDIKANIDMTDSRPLVAMMANQRGKEGWLGKALTVDDVKGEATLKLKDRRLVVPLAYASSEKIGVGVKGMINADLREGIVYVRFRKLDGLLKMRNGKKNLDILKARKTFDEYVPGKSNLETEKQEKNNR
jgi:hypothetical protein